jgi:hypothetical protein
MTSTITTTTTTPNIQLLSSQELQQSLPTNRTTRRADIEHLLMKYEKELLEIEIDIQQTKQTQVNAISEASRFLQETEVELQNLTKLQESIKTRGENVIRTFPAFEELKNAHAARTNLSTVIDQLELYSKISGKAKLMYERLEKDPTNTNILRTAGREWLGLVSWRDRVLGYVERLAILAKERQEKLQRLERGEVLSIPATTTTTTTIGSSSTDISSSSTTTTTLPLQQPLRPPETYEIMLATLKNHFRDVYVVGDLICERVYEAATNVITLATENPARLVCAAEIVERHDAQLKREMKKHLVKKKSKNELSNEFELKRMRLEFLKRLNKVADERAALCCSNTTTTTMNTATNQNHFEEAITTASRDLLLVASRIVPCLPPTYKTMSIFRKWYEARLFSMFNKAVEGATIDSQLRLIACAHRYNLLFIPSSPTALPATSAPMYDAQLPCVAFQRLSETLLDKVLQDTLVLAATAATTTTTTTTTKQSSLSNRQQLFTSQFDRLAQANVGSLNLLKFLIKLMEDKNSGLASMLQEVRLIQEQLQKSTASTFNVVDICQEMINVISCKNMLEQLMLKCFDNLVVESDDTPRLIQLVTDGVEQSSMEYEKVLEILRQLLVEKAILGFIKSDVLPFLFTVEWEQSSYPGITIICQQLDSALDDINRIIESGQEKNNIMELVFVSLISWYVKTCIQRKDLKFQNPQIASERFKEDFLELSRYFIDKGVDQCERRLSFWMSWGDIVQGTSDAIDLEGLTSAFGINGARIISKSLRLASGRQATTTTTTTTTTTKLVNSNFIGSENNNNSDDMEENVVRRRKAWFEVV